MINLKRMKVLEERTLVEHALDNNVVAAIDSAAAKAEAVASIFQHSWKQRKKLIKGKPESTTRCLPVLLTSKSSRVAWGEMITRNFPCTVAQFFKPKILQEKEKIRVKMESCGAVVMDAELLLEMLRLPCFELSEVLDQVNGADTLDLRFDFRRLPFAHHGTCALQAHP